MLFNLTDHDGSVRNQYNVFERRFADKLSYYDWKLSFQGDEEEFNMYHKDYKVAD